MKRVILTFRRRVSPVVGLLLILLLSACGSGGGTGDGNTLASLAITDTSFQRPTGVFETFQCFSSQLKVLGTFDNGDLDFTIADRAKWTSSNPNVVQVSDGDLVLTTGIPLPKGALVPSALPGAIGQTATITAQFVGLSASLDVIVRPGNLEVSPTQPTLADDTLIQMFAAAVLGGGTTDTAGANRVVGFTQGVIWESTNTAVATVSNATATNNSHGVVTAVAPGTSIIRAKTGVACPSPADAETVITVSNATLASISLQPTALFSLADIGRNTRAVLRLIGNYSGFTQDLTGLASMESSTPATIFVSGSLVQSLATSGSVTLTTRDQNDTVVSTLPAGPDNAVINANKRVNAGGLDVHPISPSTGTMLAGTAMDLDAIGNYVDAGGADQPDQNLYRDAGWTSSDATIASVSLALGRVFASASNTGTANITASRTDPVLGQTITDMTPITVVPFAASSVLPSLAVNCPQPVPAGSVADCKAALTFSAAVGGGTQDVSLFAIWSSSDPAIAEVSNAQIQLLRENELGTRLARPGRVFGTGNAGQTTITATLFDASGVQLATGTDSIDNSLPPPPPDADGDGVTDANDNCPNDANANQANNDGDANGDVCDTDDDNDTVADTGDNCPLAANTNQLNTDGTADGGDACDTDDDNDGVLDGTDQCPTVPPGAIPAGPTRPGCPCTTPLGMTCLVP